MFYVVMAEFSNYDVNDQVLTITNDEQLAKDAVYELRKRFSHLDMSFWYETLTGVSTGNWVLSDCIDVISYVTENSQGV